MNIYSNLFFSCFRSICIGAFLNLGITATFAQKTQAPATIKGAKTDNNYANTTEVSKAKNATDAQVLAEIEGNYGIGDVVRIVVTTPKPVTEPLKNVGNTKPSTINISPVPIPNGQLMPNNNLPRPPQETTTPPQYNANGQPIATNPTRPNGQVAPIGNKPAPQQGATPPQYNANGQPIATNPTRPNGQVAPISNKPAPQQGATPPQYNANGQPIAINPTRPNGQMAPIGNKPAPQQGATPPQYSSGQPMATNPTRPAGQMTPIGNKPAPQQGATPPQYNANGQPIATNPTRPNGQMAPISNKPAPQQGATPPQYNANGQPIATNPTRPNGQMAPIGNKPAPQQTMTPPQYKTNPQPNAPIVSTKTPNNNTTITASTSDKIDLSNFFDKKPDAVVTETVTNKTVETPIVEQERVERTTYTPSSRSERSSSRGSSSSSRASKSSKSSGFSFKNLFSFGSSSGYKATKRRNMKPSKKYGCYRFN